VDTGGAVVIRKRIMRAKLFEFFMPGLITLSHVRVGSKADISPCNDHVRFTPESRHSSAKRFNELPKLDGFLRPGAVPVIPIPLALWCATAGTMHPADLPASHRRRTAGLARSL
jgi:hypothetical protein